MRVQLLLFLLSLFVICSSAKAQSLVRGIVVDSATFEPLAYVSIQIKNRLKGTNADAKGNFSLQALPTDTLILSLVGYERLEFPLEGYEPGLIRMKEKETVLPVIDITDDRIYVNPYEGLFDEELAKLKKRIPFYYSRMRKDKIKAARWRDESVRVQTYINVVINDPQTRATLMKEYDLNEKQYYEVLTQFNERHYEIMYFLTEGELRSLLNKFFRATAHTR